MAFGWEKTTLGRTSLEVSSIGLGSSFGVSTEDVERAFARGINYFYWGSVRRPGFGRAIRHIARQHREEMVVVVQSYSRSRFTLGVSVERALRRLRIDYADILLLGWWNHAPPERILDGARALLQAGKVRHLMISGHNRAAFGAFIRDPSYGAIMVRYNAAHPGAEQEVFPLLDDAAGRPGVVAYTATRWGTLLSPRLIPDGEPRPRASDCYRFALTHPSVDLCLSGPKDGVELDEAMAALDRGPMDVDELSWMRRVGKAVHAATALSTSSPAHIFDRVTRRLTGTT